MKIAILHNFLDNIGGAEVVALTLTREFKADLYTTNVSAEKIKQMGFGEVLPRIKSIGWVPKNAPFRQQLTLWRFRRLNLGRQYDFYIIAGDWAMSGLVNHHPNLWYIFSPLNELWQFRNHVREDLLSWWQRPIFDAWVRFNRWLTIRYAKSADQMVSISENTRARVKKFYNQESEIIYPPTDISKYLNRPSENFWLSVNRLTRHKRIENQMGAFAKMPDERLVIVGSYEKGSRQFESYKKYLEKIKPANVEIINWATNEKLIDLYSRCKGFITTAKDEDFGMTPVEAMASGKPVVAIDEGGYRETVTNGTGVLINNLEAETIVEAVRKINENPTAYREACLARAKIFSVAEFGSKIKRVIQKE
ncbi:MAG: glycosyltransferase [Candidatus Paceibacterota bacterium]|jgi:glycosyltransferase involved in cell wall biosynthesis